MVMDFLNTIVQRISTLNPTTLIGIGAVFLILIFVFAAYRKNKSSKMMSNRGQTQRTTTELMVVAILVLVFVQLIGWLLPELLGAFGIDLPAFKVGPLFLLLVIGSGVALIYKLILKADTGFKQDDYVVVAIIVIFVIALIVVIPKVVPQVFSVAAEQISEQVITTTESMIQSIIGG